MREVRVLRVRFDPGWKKWPTSSDTDLQEIEKPFDYQLTPDLKMVCQTYPAYAAYCHAGHLKLNPGCTTPGDINNLLLPDQCVIDQQIEDFTRLSKDYDIIRWHHSTQCFPPIADVLPSLFKLRILDFGDDCPGSSERKTFPVVHGFNAFIARMLIWEYATGIRTKDKYAALGMKHFYHHIGGPLDWLTVEWAKLGVSVADKWQAIIDGRVANPLDLCFVGCIGYMNPARLAFLTELNARAGSFDFTCALHGKDMRDDLLQPSYEAGVHAAKSVAALYSRSLFGVNFPASSFFNSRLLDLPLTGVVQILHDKNNELSEYDLKPYEHYLPFDGTVDGLFSTIAEAKKDLPAMRNIAIRAEAKTIELVNTCTAAPRFIECIEDWLAGRIQ